MNKIIEDELIEGLHVLVGVFTELNFPGMLQLGSVSLVGEADDVAAAVNQANFIILTITELLNRTDVEPAAGTRTKLLAELLAILHDADFSQIEEFLAFGKQLCSLFLKLIAVNDQNNSR